MIKVKEVWYKFVKPLIWSNDDSCKPKVKMKLGHMNRGEVSPGGSIVGHDVHDLYLLDTCRNMQE